MIIPNFRTLISAPKSHSKMEDLNSAAKMAASSNQDRISDLPDPILQHILSFLPTTRDAVRSAVLSKRWRRQWTHLPHLIFEPSGDNYLKFIEDTLALHDCPRITKFHLRYDSSSNLDPQFASKIRFAVTKCVEDLSVLNLSRTSCLLPEFLIESSSLVRLEMYRCSVKSDWTVSLPSLKSLKIYCSCISDNTGIESIVSGCPVLESFELCGYLDDPTAVISTSLRVFSVVDAQILYAIKVSCPNLVEFSMECSTFPDQMVENVLLGCPSIHSLKLDDCRGYMWPVVVIASDSLKVLHLECVSKAEIEVSCPNLVKLDMLCYGDSFCKRVNLPSTVCATLDLTNQGLSEAYVENKLLELFQHLSSLTIQRSLVEVISNIDVEGRPPLPILKSKILTLNIGDSFGMALPGIAHALGSPMLETLVIKLGSKSHEDLRKDDNLELIRALCILKRLDYWNSKKSTSFACLESHLMTVEIIGLCEADDNCMLGLELIKFLLSKARVLKKTVSLEKSSKDFVVFFPEIGELPKIFAMCRCGVVMFHLARCNSTYSKDI